MIFAAKSVHLMATLFGAIVGLCLLTPAFAEQISPEQLNQILRDEKEPAKLQESAMSMSWSKARTSELLMRRAVELAQAKFGKNDARTIPFLAYLGYILTIRDDKGKSAAHDANRDCMKVAESCGATTIQPYCEAIYQEASLLQNEQNVDGLLELLNHTKTVLKNPKHDRTTQCCANVYQRLGQVYRAKNDMANAIKQEEFLVALYRQHGLTEELETELQTLGDYCVWGNKVEESIAAYRECLTLRKKISGVDSNGSVEIRNSLIHYLKSLKRFDEAIAMVDEQLSIVQASKGEDSAEYMKILNEQLDVFKFENNKDEIKKVLKHMLAVNERKYGKNSPEAILLVSRIADACLDNHEVNEAEILFEDAYSRNSQNGHPENYRELVKFYFDQVEYAKADKFLKVRLAESEHQNNPADQAQALSSLIQLYSSEHLLPEDILPYYQKLAAIDNGKRVDNVSLIELYISTGEPAKAESLARARLTSLEKAAAGPCSDLITSRLAESYCLLGESLKAQKKTSEAKNAYLKAITTFQVLLGPQHQQPAPISSNRMLNDSLASLLNFYRVVYFRKAISGLADGYIDEGKVKAAETLLLQSIGCGVYQRAGLCPFYEQLGRIYELEGLERDAESAYRKSRAYKLNLIMQDPFIREAMAQCDAIASELAKQIYLDPDVRNAKLNLDQTAAAIEKSGKMSSLDLLSPATRADVLEYCAIKLNRSSPVYECLPLIIQARDLRKKLFSEESAAVAHSDVIIATILASTGGFGHASTERAFKSVAKLTELTKSSRSTVASSQPLADKRYASANTILALANLLGQSDQNKDSLTLISDLFDSIDDKKVAAVTFENFMSGAEVCANLLAYSSARKILQLALNKFAGSPADKIACNLKLAQLSLLESDFSESIAYGNSALQLSDVEPHRKADILATLSHAHSGDANLDQAIGFAEQSLKLRLATPGLRNDEKISSLLDAASLNAEAQRSEAANKLCEQALALADTDKSVDTTDRAAIHAVMGKNALAQGNVSEARLHLNQSINLQESIPTLLSQIQSQQALAQLDLLDKNPSGARTHALVAAKASDKYIDTTFNTLSFPEQCAFTASLREQVGLLLSSCSSDEDVPVAYGFLSKWKGLLVESLRRQTAAATLASQDNAGITFSRLSQLRHQLSNRMLDNNDADMQSLVSEEENLERALSSRYGAAKIIDPMTTFGSLQRALQADEAFIDIYHHHQSSAGSKGDNYAAVITTQKNQSILHTLEDQVNFDERVMQWLAIVGGGSIEAPQEVQPSHIAVAPRESARSIQVVGADKLKSSIVRTDLENDLSQFVTKLFRHLPSQVKKVWICADGESFRLPWSNLAQTQPGLESFQISQIDSPRELVLLRKSAAIERKHTQSPNQSPSASTEDLLLIGGVKFGTNEFSPLPKTLKEIEDIGAIADHMHMTTKSHTGADAGVALVTADLQNCFMAHLATHGFFAHTSTAKIDNDTRAGNVFSTGLKLSLARNPLVQSGIVLAPDKGSNTGILTAEEIIGLDMQHCNLLTLSACETGLGQTYSGQGVMGLRAAVMAAGARSMLISLWKVPDSETQQLMTEFYRNLLGSHLSKVESLRKAQAVVRSEHADPYYWASWVIVGEGW